MCSLPICLAFVDYCWCSFYWTVNCVFLFHVTVCVITLIYILYRISVWCKLNSFSFSSHFHAPSGCPRFWFQLYFFVRFCFSKENYGSWIWGHVNWRVFTLYLTDTEQHKTFPITSILDANCETSTVFFSVVLENYCRWTLWPRVVYMYFLNAFLAVLSTSLAS